jgi:ubiquinone/menaquinone biosynthesis C-methylase UbiE
MTQTGATANDDRDDYQQMAFDNVIVGERLCASLAIPAGARVLDIGCGTGNTAIAAARRRAIVTGIDINERSLARARLRAEAEGLTSIEFKNADASAIPFTEASFDYVLSTVGLVFLPDKERAASELARIAKAGGVIGLTSYTRQSLPAQIYELVNSLYRNPRMPAVPYYAWAEAPLAGELLGPYFHNVRIRLDSFDVCFRSSAAMFDHISTWNPPIRMAVEASAPDVRQALRQGCLSIIDRFNRATDGTLMANMDYAIITGVRADKADAHS